MAIKVCFLSGARYDQPLDATSEKKFRALKSLGELFVIGFSQDLYPRRFIEQAHFYLLPKLPLSILRYAMVFTAGPCLALWLIVRHGVQLFVAQSPYEGCVIALAKRIASWFGRKTVLIVESHGDFEGSLFLQRRILFPGLYRSLMRCAARFSLKHADLLRAVSAYTRKQLVTWHPGKPIFQFATWTDIEPFLQSDETSMQPSKEILYAGVLIPLKAVHHLISAFAHVSHDFPQAGLVIVGREENKAYAAELKVQVERVGLNGRVRFLGEVPQAELARWMRQACVLVLPSFSEGLPRVIFEAMATGTPVIGTSVGGIPELVQDGVTGFLVPPGDEAVLAERLRWVLVHPEEAAEVGRRARTFAERFFSTGVYVAGYRQIFAAAQALLDEKDGYAPSTL